MKILATILLIVGTILLAAEAFGRERIQKWEVRLRQLAEAGKDTFGSIVTYTALPWKKISPEESPRFLPRWVAVAFIAVSLLSWWLVHAASQRFGETRVMLVILSSYIIQPGSTVVFAMVVTAWRRGVTHFKGIRRWLIHGIALITGLLLLTIFLISFLLVLIGSFPASIILGLYAFVYLVCWGLGRFLAWKERHNMGSVFVFMGIAITITGIVIQSLL